MSAIPKTEKFSLNKKAKTKNKQTTKKTHFPACQNITSMFLRLVFCVLYKYGMCFPPFIWLKVQIKKIYEDIRVLTNALLRRGLCNHLGVFFNHSPCVSWLYRVEMWNSGTWCLLSRCPIIEKLLSLSNSALLTFSCLVAWHCKYVAWSVLGEVRLWLVDLGLHHDGTLSTIHTALNGACSIHLELPLLTRRNEKKKEKD